MNQNFKLNLFVGSKRPLHIVPGELDDEYEIEDSKRPKLLIVPDISSPPRRMYYKK